MDLNGTKVTVTYYGAEFSDGSKGAVMDATPQGTCDNCRWAQTVSRTGAFAEATHTDRQEKQGAEPLYPLGANRTSNANLYDQPSTPHAGTGTFRAVSVLGIADTKNKTFKPIGAITWGYNIDKRGNLSVVPLS